VTPVHKELHFEDQIEQHLLENGGYLPASPEHFDRAHALFHNDVLAFLKATQPKQWQQLERLHGKSTSDVIISDLLKGLDIQGSLATLRHGFKCFGITLKMAYFKPATQLNEETERLYAANRLTATRQVRYS
jgi:type I restriction enzyme, R subunit